MKIERTKNAFRNFLYGLVFRIYSIVFPFAVRTAIIHYLGVEYLGLSSLYSSILQTLNLAELGVGSAMVFSMYEPIAKDDKAKICSLLNLYKAYYRVIGLVILISGLIIMPALPLLAKQDVPTDVNIYILFFLNLLATVLSYWLFAYRNCLFQAFQRVDIITKITLVSDTVKYCGQLVALTLFRNFSLFFVIGVLGQVMHNILVLLLAKKHYPDINPCGSVTKEEKGTINARIRDLFTSRLGWTIISSSDTIIISFFLGLKVLAIYQNYYYIVSALQGMIIILFNSVVAGSGNSMIVESKEKNYHDLKKLSFITNWILGYCCAGILCAIQVFVELWVGNDLLLPFYYAILLCFAFAGNIIVQLLSVYKDAAGIWHEDRYRPLVSGATNIVLTVILINCIGLSGVVLGTIISELFVSGPWIMKNVFSLIFPGCFRDYAKQMLEQLFATSVSAALSCLICSFIPGTGMSKLIANIVACSIIYNSLMYVIYGRSGVFFELLGTLKNLLRIRSKNS